MITLCSNSTDKCAMWVPLKVCPSMLVQTHHNIPQHGVIQHNTRRCKAVQCSLRNKPASATLSASTSSACSLFYRVACHAYAMMAKRSGLLVQWPKLLTSVWPMADKPPPTWSLPGCRQKPPVSCLLRRQCSSQCHQCKTSRGSSEQECRHHLQAASHKTQLLSFASVIDQSGSTLQTQL